MKTPRYNGLPNVDSMRVIPHPDDRVAPTSEHKKAITENMQKEFDKARGLPPAPIATQDLYFEPGTEPKPTAAFTVKCYRALAEVLFQGHPEKYIQRGEFHLKNGMIVVETESWRKTDKRVYRIFKNDEDEQGIFATSDLDVLVTKLWELGAL